MISNTRFNSTRDGYWLLLFFVVVKFVLQYALINSSYDLHRDEYLHLDQGKHLAWGFISVAPFTSWTSYIIALLGNGVFWVKFFPALYGALTVVVAWFTVGELKGNLFAKEMVSVALIFSVILRMNILYQPNSLDILCWTFFYLTVLKYINTGNYKWLWMAGITFGIGFLNKYNILFLVAGMLPAILLTPHRKVFLNRHFYIAVLFALLIISPNIIWQYQNGFPAYHHMKTLAATQLVNVERGNFLKSQLLFFYNSIYVLFAGLLSFFIYKSFSGYRVFLYSFIITLLIFVYLKAKDYYAIGLYPVLLAFGAVYLEYLLRSGWKLFMRPVLILACILLSVPFIKIGFPIYTPEEIARKSQNYKALGLLRWEDGKDHTLPQDFADMLGWHELANKVDSVYDTLSDKSHTLVYCDNYGEAGAINYYSKNKSIGAVSLNADYVNWFPLKKMVIRNIIFVKEKENNDRSRERAMFDTLIETGLIKNSYAREEGTHIYLLKGAKINIDSIFSKEIEARKKEW